MERSADGLSWVPLHASWKDDLDVAIRDRDADPSAAQQYRIRVRNASGRTSAYRENLTVPPPVPPP